MAPSSTTRTPTMLSSGSANTAATITTTTTRQNAKLLTPTTKPIPLLHSSPLIKPYNIAHTLGVWVYYYLRASSLVADPLTTLIQDLLPVASLQAVFCAICLPSAGNWISTTAASGSGDDGSAKIADTVLRGGKSSGTSAVAGSIGGSGAGSLRRKGGALFNKSGAASAGAAGAAGASVPNRITAAIFSLILAFSVPPVPLTVLALVLGAPLYPTSLLPHTVVLSVHVALLAFLPIFYTHGVSAAAWRDVAAAWLPFDEAGVWSGVVGCMVGGWIGAIPIALDWDREWQKWPCTVVWGAVLGWGTGRLMTSMLQMGIGTRINLSEGRRTVGFGVDQKPSQASEQKVK